MPTYRIVIPAGVPPHYLPTSAPEAEETLIEKPSVSEGLFKALQAGEHSGLLDSSTALESGLGEAPKVASPRRGSAPSRPQGGGVPSDDEILSWSSLVREHGKQQGLLYRNSALKYWVRYTFRPYTREYRAVGKRIDAIVSEV